MKLKNSFIRPVSQRISWNISKLDLSERYHVLGFPKSGTTWVTNLISNIFNKNYYRDTVVPVFGAAVLHGHFDPSYNVGNKIVVIRDIRDVYISLYFHRLNEKGINADKFDLNLFKKFLFKEYSSPKSVPCNWSQYYSNCNIEGVIKYESLCDEPYSALRQYFTNNEFDGHSDDNILDAIHKCSFDNKKSSASLSDQKFLRSGGYGKWRNFFDDDALSFVYEKHFKTMNKFGYTK